MVSWFHYHGSEVRQNIMAKRAWCCKTAYLMTAKEYREQERVKEKWAKDKYCP